MLVKVAFVCVTALIAAMRDFYKDYFDYIAANPRLRTMTLPFEGGLEMTICAE